MNADNNNTRNNTTHAANAATERTESKTQQPHFYYSNGKYYLELSSFDTILLNFALSDFFRSGKYPFYLNQRVMNIQRVMNTGLQFATLFYTYNAPVDTDIRTSDGLYADSVSIPFKTYDDVPVDCPAVLDFDKNGKLMNFDLL